MILLQSSVSVISWPFMELRHLRYFAAVAQHLNYTQAARHLHVAQPAISQTILDLEDELGLSVPELVDALVGAVSTNRGCGLRTRRAAGLPTAGGTSASGADPIASREGPAQQARTSFRHPQGGKRRWSGAMGGADADRFTDTLQGPATEPPERHAGQIAHLVANDGGGEHLAAVRGLGHSSRNVHDVPDDVAIA